MGKNLFKNWENMVIVTYSFFIAIVCCINKFLSHLKYMKILLKIADAYTTPFYAIVDIFLLKISSFG